MNLHNKLVKLTAVCLFMVMLMALFLAAGCGAPASTITEKPSEPELPPDIPAVPTSPDLAEIKANEAGKVMILMYHVIGAAAEKAWMQTAENFRRDLRLLNEQNYSLISLHDFITNNIKTPAGRTPVILTFDDASAGHFRYISGEDGKKEIDPECAVGILLAFGEKNPEFGHTATFFINDRPFGQPGEWREKLTHLVKLGFDIGNHTLTHPKLNRLNDQEVQKELAGLARLVRETVPGYEVRSLALPHGISPLNRGLAARGSYNGDEYYHEAILRVGANPAKSPNAAGFDPYALPRVQASTEELGKWLKYFQENPGERYISDGDPLTIAIPREKEGLLELNSIGDKKLVFWSN